MTRGRRWLAAASFVFAMNFGWEMAQGGLYAGMNEMSFRAATLLCLLATMGDVVIVAIAYGVAMAVARRVEWFAGARTLSASVAFVSTGLVITVVYERWALSTGRWQYGPGMPVIFGIGATPLLQWIVLPLLFTVFFRFVSTRDPHPRG